jgi:hypothetical protein
VSCRAWLTVGTMRDSDEEEVVSGQHDDALIEVLCVRRQSASDIYTWIFI